MDISRAHELLGVTAETSIDEVRKKYRVRSRMMHPDSQQDPLLKDEAAHLFRELNEAWEVIQDEELRGTRGKLPNDSVNEALRADRPEVPPHPAPGQQAARAGTTKLVVEDKPRPTRSFDGLYLWLGGPVVILLFGSFGKTFFDMGLDIFNEPGPLPGRLLGTGLLFVVGALFAMPAVVCVLVMLLMLFMFIASRFRSGVLNGTSEIVPTTSSPDVQD
jgi:hypothetical protein